MNSHNFPGVIVPVSTSALFQSGGIESVRSPLKMHKSIITQQSPGLIKGFAPQIFNQATKLMQLEADEEKNKMMLGAGSFRDNGA